VVVNITDVAGDSPLSFVATSATTSATTVEVRVNPTYVSPTPSNLEGFEFKIVPNDGWDAIGDYLGVLEYGWTSSFFDEHFDFGVSALNNAYVAGANAASGATTNTEPATIGDTRFLTDAGVSNEKFANDVATTEATVSLDG
jgi:hypothetical protein